MTFAKELWDGNFPITLEITPPKISKPTVLLRRASLLESVSSAVNIIHRPNRQSSFAAALELQKSHIEPIWHLTVGGKSRDTIQTEIENAQAVGLENILCLLGDNTSKGDLKVHETITLLREKLSPSLIATAFDQYQEKSNKYDILSRKIAAGATCIWTQPVLESKKLQKEAERLKSTYPDTLIIAMAMPLIRGDQLARITERLKIPEQPNLENRINAGENEAWKVFDETVLDLATSPYIDGLAIMTFETDPKPQIGERIITSLKLAKNATQGA